MGIHYDQLAVEHRKAKKAKKKIKLVVGGMLALGRYREGHEREGEPIPAALPNGTTVEVLEVGVDSVKVVAVDGERKGKEVTFAHAKGADKLSYPDDESPEASEAPATGETGTETGTGGAAPDGGDKE